jgi:hypothetical protein
VSSGPHDSCAARPLAPALALVSLALAAAGCARCNARNDAEVDAGPVTPLTLPAPLPTPKAWTFYRAPPYQYALPEGCVERAPPVRALLPATTRFVAEPHALATLVVGETESADAKLVAAGALALSPDGASGAATALPWTEAPLLPKLARGASGDWIAAIDLPSTRPEGPTRVAIWRGGVAETVGEGDGFVAIDLGCAGDRCALVATRLASVWQPGASVWIGAPKAPIAAWKRVDIALPATETEARLLSLSRLDASAVEVAILQGEQVVFWSATDPPHEVARVPANAGVLDASSDPLPIALTHGAPVDEDGCPKDPSGAPPSIRIERAGLPPVELKTVAPPVAGSIRRVGEGSLVAWLAPAGCRSPHRAATAIAFDAKGAPRSPTPATLGEASGYAIASAGAEVDLWFQAEPFVTWVRARCDAKPKP